MLIIPAIDLRGGRCVRLTQGDYGRETVYDLDPVEVALGFGREGAEIVHVVDLDGAKSGAPENLEIVARIVREGGLPVEFGGGVRSLETARRLLDLGVARVVVGSKLVQDAELSARFFSELGDRVVAGIDAREGKVATIGWTETSGVSAVELAQRVEAAGCRRIILTDIARDGALRGPNVDLLREVVGAVSIPVIASGGVSVVEDLRVLREAFPAGVEGVIVGKAIYEDRFTVAEAVAALAL
ncbi:MAG: 1-(5-phosphoribosyl)-5-[(5-phosphoribosylamino)methylideneamino]imidazole-4-carboxamide isomerase [Fimbriimonas sp.]